MRTWAGFARAVAYCAIWAPLCLDLAQAQPPVDSELLLRRQGALTAAAPTLSDEAIVRGHLAQQFALDDVETLVVLGDSPGGSSGLRLLRMQQQVHGLAVFGTEIRAVLDRDRRLWRILGNLVPGVSAALPADRVRLLAPGAALAALLAADGVALAAADVVATEGEGGYLKLSAAAVAGEASARLVWFASAPGRLRAAWSLVVPGAGEHDWYAVVDALDGKLLWRRNLREQASAHPARFAVYVQADGRTPADSPAPQSPSAALPGAGSQFPRIARSTVSMLAVQDIAASPNGWIDDCPGAGDGCNSTRGNNVEACLDRDATPNVCDASLDGSGRPRGNPDAATRERDFLGSAPRDFEYAPAPEAGNPNAGDPPTNPDSQRGALVQAFYVANWFHDRMYALGFDEAAGNYQALNLHGQGGLGGDRIAIDVQNTGSSAGNFSAVPDGAGVGRLQISLFDSPAPDRDGALDSALLLHELTHGMTHRLIGNATGLLWDPARSLGEGWSDFYALALLNSNQGDHPDGAYPFGSYATYQLAGLVGDNYFYGFRRFPYSTDNSINPLTWADVDAVTANDADGAIAPSPMGFGNSGALEVHNAGTLWALSLWEVRARIIADPAGANGDVASGNQTMLQLVTDALKLTPANPSFIDARDALFLADCAAYACAHEASLWAGFADRGLGYRARGEETTGGRFARAHVGVGTSFALPQLDVREPAVDVLVDDSASGNGDGRLDPGENASLAVTLHNPWRGAGRAASGVIATLSSSTPGVSIADAQGAYPDIPPLSQSTNTANRYRIALAPGLACGQRLSFTLQLQSSLGPQAATFSVRVGTPGPAGVQRVWSASPDLPIPDNRADGVSSALAVAEDLEIADLDFRIDSLTHPVTGQVSVMLRAPDGTGSDLVWRRGGLMSPNQGVAADLIGVTIDDDLPLIAAEDLNQSTVPQAPFTGDWLPAWNSPFWDGYATTPAVQRDAIPQLQRLDGSSSAGIWQVHAADGNATAAGSLNGWSILVRPRSYACSVFLPAIFANGFE